MLSVMYNVDYFYQTFMHTYTELFQEESDIFYKTMAKISKIIRTVMSTNYKIIFRVFLLYFMSPC
jgi:hypothetical protein